MNTDPREHPADDRFDPSSYEFDLPEDLVAQDPASRREDARLLLVRRPGQDCRAREDLNILDLPRLLAPGDLLVLNETRVVPARLKGTRVSTGGQAEVLVLEHQDGAVRIMLGTRGKPLPGEEIAIADDALRLTLETNDGEGLWRARSAAPDAAIRRVMQDHGSVPLPPYIRRPDAPKDRDRYQTVYARNEGAVAAPTAGLHLTRGLLDTLASNGVERTAVTLHVGPGTFRPVSVDDIRDHPMHEERYEVPESAAAAIDACRRRGGRIVAVGTTVVRVLEAAADGRGGLTPGQGRTSLFIHPPWEFQLVDALLTNFHAPKSTLLMLICALAGRDRILDAYTHAVRERYRLLSYGDAMFIA